MHGTLSSLYSWQFLSWLRYSLFAQNPTFIHIFTKAHHWTLCWITSIHCTPSNRILHIHFNIFIWIVFWHSHLSLLHNLPLLFCMHLSFCFNMKFVLRFFTYYTERNIICIIHGVWSESTIQACTWSAKCSWLMKNTFWSIPFTVHILVTLLWFSSPGYNVDMMSFATWGCMRCCVLSSEMAIPFSMSLCTRMGTWVWTDKIR